MLRNYFKTAWRNLIRNKSFSVINIAGLALGMTCSLLIMLWIQDERNVDAFHENGKQLYQVYERNYFDGKVEASYTTQGLLATELKRVVPEVEYASGFESVRPATFQVDDKIGKMNGSNADADFFSMFSFPLLQGTKEGALKDPDGISISRKMAEYFFGTAANAIGKSIVFENKDNLQVTAVFENPPSNSSLQFDFLRTWKAYIRENAWVYNWSNTSPVTYVQLKKNVDRERVAARIKDFIHLYQPKTAGFRTELELQPYPDTYLHSNLKNGEISEGRVEYVRLFSVVAIFILLVACINFMNLATARSASRAKEVGVRKVIGAGRSTLMAQFVGEAILITFLSVIMAVVLSLLLLPAFNSLTGKQLSMPVSQPLFWLSLAGLLLFTGLIAGSYPAFFLSSLNPVRVLKGRLRFGRGAVFFRKGLVIFQFGLSIILIVGMVVIYRQMEYTQSVNLGYNRQNLLYVPIEGDLVKNYSIFKEQAERMPGIVSVSKMRESPTVVGHHTGDIDWEGKAPGLSISFTDAIVGYDFVKTMNLQLKEGRDFGKDFGTDTTSFILNEAAVQKIGYKDPVGKIIRWGNRRGPVIGVLKDFHFNSMHSAIEPLVVRLNEKQPWGNILVRTGAGKTQEAITSLEKLSKEFNPKFPFTFQFSDQEYAKLYNSEMIVSKLTNYFAFLAIFISCLGLFGLTMFTVSQRVKEIGVRKVLGASVPNIAVLLVTNFLKPVAFAILLASPLANFIMNKWLQGFAYKIDIDWWVFAIAGLITVAIGLLTVSFQSIKAALSNPVKSLRSE